MANVNTNTQNLNKLDQSFNTFVKSKGILNQISKAILFIVLVIVSISILKFAYVKIKSFSNRAPWLFKGTKSGKKRMVIQQDPNKAGSIVLRRSQNQFGGLEFTYMWWMFVDDWIYQENSQRHIFHKGNENLREYSTSGGAGADNSCASNIGAPKRPLLQCPGVWLEKNTNKMVVYINTFKDIEEKIEIDNIPGNKWLHVAVSVKQSNLDVYVNGYLAKRKALKSPPKQNYGDLYINSFKGFGGYLSNFKYSNYYATFSDIESHMSLGPSNQPCVDTGEKPPYFSSNWWITR